MMSLTKNSERIRQETLKGIEAFTLFDDTFMTKVFADNPECIEFVLSVILDKQLKVVESATQYKISNLHGNFAILDIKAVDSENNLYNIEVQRENEGAKPRRARRNSSLLDSNCKDMGEYGENLPETYIIFITQKDYWKEGLPIYVFDRKCTNIEKPILFDDGLHIIYVNGAYKGNDKIGDLMHDFSCANPDDMKNHVLRKNTMPYKKDEKEVGEMCQIVENINKIAIEEAIEVEREERAIEALKLNLPIEQIQKLFKLSDERIRELQEEILVED